MFRDRTEATLFRPGTVPVPIPVLSLVIWYCKLIVLPTQPPRASTHFKLPIHRHVTTTAMDSDCAFIGHPLTRTVDIPRARKFIT